jgi:hypothetical protein
MLTITKHDPDSLTDTLSDGTVVDHDCYAEDTMDYTVETYTFYQPTPEQIDNNTDHDEEGRMAVCVTCGEDMPNIDVTPDEPDYDEGDR